MRIIIAADLHYTVGIEDEIDATESLMYPSHFDHITKAGSIWHNRLLFEDVDNLLDALKEMVVRERADMCVLVGDLVNTNWSENVKAVAERLRDFPCPLHYVRGNHDVYMPGKECELSTFLPHPNGKTGARYDIFDNMGILYLDNFIMSPEGRYDRDYVFGETWGVGYRPEDIAKLGEILDEHGEVQFILFSHMHALPLPAWLYEKSNRIAKPVRELTELFFEKTNLRVAISGHGHYTAFGEHGNGIQWALPSLIEYPCAAAVVDIDSKGISGVCQTVNETLMKKSCIGQDWTFGTESDRQISIQPAGRQVPI